MSDRETFIKRMNEIEEKILKREKIKFGYYKGDTAQIDFPVSLRDIALKLIEISYKYNTYYLEGENKGEIQTSSGRKRSCQDLFLLAKYYGINCTYLDLYHELLLLSLNNSPLGTWFCGTVWERVFWDTKKHGTNSTSPTKNTDEFGISPLDIFAYFGDTINCSAIAQNSFPVYKIGTNFSFIYNNGRNKKELFIGDIITNKVVITNRQIQYVLYEKGNTTIYDICNIFNFENTYAIYSPYLQEFKEYKNPKLYSIHRTIISPNMKFFFNDEWYKEKENEDIFHFPNDPDKEWFKDNWSL